MLVYSPQSAGVGFVSSRWSKSGYAVLISNVSRKVARPWSASPFLGSVIRRKSAPWRAIRGKFVRHREKGVRAFDPTLVFDIQVFDGDVKGLLTARKVG